MIGNRTILEKKTRRIIKVFGDLSGHENIGWRYINNLQGGFVTVVNILMVKNANLMY